jgi:hypothetical protein
MSDLSELYRTDYSAWASRTVELLRAGDFRSLDLDHLLEELSDMGKSERRELENRLTVLIAHLLKWQYQLPTLSARWQEFDGRSGRSAIVEQRDRLAKRLGESPGLKAVFAETLPEAYRDAVSLAAKETGLAQDTFPADCPYSAVQILDDGFFPDGAIGR